MVIGTGVDIIEIERVGQASGNEAFLSRVFTEQELCYCRKTDGSYREESLAGLFAAKEAAAKALGSGFSAIRPNEIEITHTAAGRPEMKLLSETFRKESFVCHVSISHDRSQAVAVVVMEMDTRTKEEKP